MSNEPQLGGVVRVRRLRERDSRTGLTTAITEERRAAERVTRIQELLDTLPEPPAGGADDAATFAARRHAASALGEALTRARAELADAHRITLAARDRWRSDHSRLAAVESLVERRAEAHRAEQRRHETKELDAVAEDLWRRNQPGEAAG
jgi:flagellar FliJ protein